MERMDKNNFYVRLAAKYFNIPVESVTSTMREYVKRLFYLCLYSK